MHCFRQTCTRHHSSQRGFSSFTEHEMDLRLRSEAVRWCKTSAELRSPGASGSHCANNPLGHNYEVVG